jgi:hypothetical protein
MSFIDEAKLPIKEFDDPEISILSEITDSLAISYVLPATQETLDFDPTINDGVVERSYRTYVAMEGEKQLSRLFPEDTSFVEILDSPEVRVFIDQEVARRRACVESWAIIMDVADTIDFSEVDRISRDVMLAHEDSQLPRDGDRILVGSVYDALSHYFASDIHFERAAFTQMLQAN